jgi:hypothetical protein
MRLLGLAALLILCGTWTQAQNKGGRDAVPGAVEAGRRFLYQATINLQKQNLATGGIRVGELALYAIALLEAGTNHADPVMVAIANRLRSESYSQTATYDVALCMMFLDRWGSSQDTGLIQFLGVRLMLGQLGSGGYGYSIGNAPNAEEERRLKSLLSRDINLKSVPKTPSGSPAPKSKRRDDLPDADGKIAPAAPISDNAKTEPKIEEKKSTEESKSTEETKPKTKPIHPEVAKLIVNIVPTQEGQVMNLGGADNSNTQFATIGLILARKYGLPVEENVKKLDQYYRQSQGQDGGWSYHGGQGTGSTPAMTCAGLIGIASWYGSADNKNDPRQDQTLTKGLDLLAKTLETHLQPAQGDTTVTMNLYFMWGMERVAVALGLEQLGQVDWYRWASNILIKTQSRDGSWSNMQFTGSNPTVSTALALLVLKKANFAVDLTSKMKGKLGDVNLSGRAQVKLPRPEAKVGMNPPPANDTSNLPPPPMTEPNSAPKLAVPTGNFSPESKRLLAEFQSANPEMQSQLIDEYREKKGALYSETLAALAGTLTGEKQRQARDALSNRLTRMTAKTLKSFLSDPDREFRRAACLAIALKPEASLIAEVIERLEDNEEIVWSTARAALVQLTKEDHPITKSDLTSRRTVAERYREWLKQNH